MSELTLTLVKFAYLAILWIFVLSAISVVRSDLFGARVESSSRAERRAQRAANRRAKAAHRPRGTPSQVVVVSGSNVGAAAPLEQGMVLVGRGADAQIQLDDDYVSTRHARIAASEGHFYVEDLGSTNGTYLGNQRVSRPTGVQTGSQVRVGKTVLELRK